MSDTKIVCKVVEHPKLADLDSMLTELNKNMDDSMMFIVKNAKKVNKDYDKNHTVIWDNITEYLLEAGLINQNDADNRNIGFMDGHLTVSDRKTKSDFESFLKGIMN